MENSHVLEKTSEFFQIFSHVFLQKSFVFWETSAVFFTTRCKVNCTLVLTFCRLSFKKLEITSELLGQVVKNEYICAVRVVNFVFRPSILLMIGRHGGFALRNLRTYV